MITYDDNRYGGDDNSLLFNRFGQENMGITWGRHKKQIKYINVSMPECDRV